VPIDEEHDAVDDLRTKRSKPGVPRSGIGRGGRRRACEGVHAEQEPRRVVCQAKSERPVGGHLEVNGGSFQVVRAQANKRDEHGCDE
jgi:hypothetical protein